MTAPAKTSNQTALFAQAMEPVSNFAAAFEERGFAPVPEGWFVATTDVVRSRDAIAKGHYKEVNMAGVAMISGLMNALGSRDIPYVFGGDGAAVVFSPAEKDVAADTLAKVATFAAEELALQLRAAIIPVDHLRESGFDVRIKPIRLSEAVRNYAFTGGGVSEAERLMKDGQFLIDRAPPGARPDLSGLSCRWTPIKPSQSEIVSMIVEAGRDVSPDEFAQIARILLDRFGLASGAGNPMPAEGPGVSWPVDGLGLEARAARGAGALWPVKIRLFFDTILAYAVLRFNLPIGKFKPRHYRRYTGLNTDFRKVHDGLRMTLALGADERQRLEIYLEALREKQKVRYGLCVQDMAVITCYVPSIMEDTHMHFLDGAGGGYAEAASNMRE